MALAVYGAEGRRIGDWRLEIGEWRVEESIQNSAFVITWTLDVQC